MNRRGFFKSLGVLAAGFTVLPSALTYPRNWKALPSGVLISNADMLLYNRLPYYLCKMQLKQTRIYELESEQIKWEPNMGNTIRSVTKEPTTISLFN